METSHAAGIVRAKASGVRSQDSADAGRQPGAGAPTATEGRRGEDSAAGTATAVLGRISDQLSRRVGTDDYARFFDGQVSMRLLEGRLEVSAPNGFMARLLGRRFGEVLREVTRQETGRDECEVHFEVAEGDPRAAAAPAPAAHPLQHSEQGHPDDDRSHEPRPRARRAPAHDRPAGRPYSLDDFVVGTSNQLAYDAALRIAEDTGPLAGRNSARSPSSCSPLFIHGRCGMGKTHLLQGIAARFLQGHPGAQVRCTTGEAFTNEFVSAVREAGATGRAGSGGSANGSGGKGLERFRKSYRRVDLLCIDDVHFLASKLATQGELLHTFDALDLAGARIVLASDEHPRQVRQFSEALVSRFMSGMVARLDAPDRDMCERIVRRLAQRRALVLEDAAVRTIALHACALPFADPRSNGGAPRTDADGTRGAGGRGGLSIREIEGLLTRIEALSRLVPDRATGTAGGAQPQDGPRRVGMLVVQRALGIGTAPAAPPDSPPDPLMDGAPRPVRPVRLDMIIAHACQMLRVDLNDLVGRGRHPRVVLARSIIAVLARRLTTMSYPEIARGMGRPNHSTIVTAYQRLKAQIDAGRPAGLQGASDITLGELCDRLAGVILHAAARA